MSERKYPGYDTLLKRVQRCKGVTFENPGSVATLLLECFYMYNGFLNAEHAYAKKVCERGKFKEWRTYLIQEGFIIYTGKEEGLYWKHAPGFKLVDLINKNLNLTGVVATQDWVLKRCERLEKAIKNLIKKFDPPFTEEKVKLYLEEDEIDKIPF